MTRRRRRRGRCRCPAAPSAGCIARPLADALRSLSAHGFRSIELTTAPPHLFTRHFGSYERKDLARAAAERRPRSRFCEPELRGHQPGEHQPGNPRDQRTPARRRDRTRRRPRRGVRGGDPRPEARAVARPRRRGTGRPRRGTGKAARHGQPSLASRSRSRTALTATSARPPTCSAWSGHGTARGCASPTTSPTPSPRRIRRKAWPGLASTSRSRTSATPGGPAGRTPRSAGARLTSPRSARL